MLQILKLTIPIALQSLIAVGMNMADSLMLNAVGQAQLSAAAFAGQVTTFFLILSMGIGLGAGVLTTRYWGQGDLHRLKCAVTLLLRWELCLTAGFAGAVLLWPTQLMGLFTRDSEIMAYGAGYLRCLLPGYFAMASAQSCTIVLRSAGKLLVPVLASLLGLGVNAGLNGLLIPRLEILGAGMATSAAWTVQALVICGYFFLAEQELAYRPADLRLSGAQVQRDYLHITLPVLLSDGLLGLGTSVMSMVVGRLGDTAAAANSIAMVVWQLSGVLQQGLAGAAGVLIGHALGRGERASAAALGRRFARLGAVVGLVTAVGIYLLRRPVIAHYDVTPATGEMAWQFITVLLWTVVLQCVSGVLTKGILRAGGDTRFLLWADCLFLWALALPLGIYAARQGAAPAWVFLLLRADLPVKCLWCLWRLGSGKWMKRV